MELLSFILWLTLAFRSLKPALPPEYELLSGSRFSIQFEYVVRPPSMNVVVPFLIGPSRWKRLVRRPSPRDPLTLLALPSRPLTSSTEDMRPPNSAGMELLYSSIPLITSVLKAENSPNMCDGLLYVQKFVAGCGSV